MAPDSSTNAANSGEEPSGVVDWATALSSAHNSEAILRDVAAMFLDEAPKKLAALRQSWQRGDSKGAAREAHTLKGDFRIFGCTAAADCAWHLESRLQSGDRQVQPLIAAMEDETDRVLSELREFLG
jgi:HPt (histidine-containing phosphotransfer) domain-containing protein